MGGFEHVDVEVLVREHRAADRRDADRAVQQAELLQHLGGQPMDHPVRAAGAVVRHVLGEAGRVEEGLFVFVVPDLDALIGTDDRADRAATAVFGTPVNST
jgi:hypothetical protein